MQRNAEPGKGTCSTLQRWNEAEERNDDEEASGGRQRKGERKKGEAEMWRREFSLSHWNENIPSPFSGVHICPGDERTSVLLEFKAKDKDTFQELK